MKKVVSDRKPEGASRIAKLARLDPWMRDGNTDQSIYGSSARPMLRTKGIPEALDWVIRDREPILGGGGQT
jgi:hypothetical protein